MITDHTVTKKTEFYGDKATVILGIEAQHVDAKDAAAAEVAFDRFVTQITSSISMTKLQISVIPWTDEEKAVVSQCKDGQEAWKVYHEAFPKSHRSKSAILRWWTEYHARPTNKPADGLPTCIEETGCAGCKNGAKDLGECDLCSPPKDEAKKPPGENNDKGNKFGIPLDLFRTDKKKYQRLWSRCKNKGITYEAALALEGQTKHGRSPKLGECDLCSPPKDEAKKPPGENNDKGNKFGIPLDLFRTDKKKYQRLWSRCKNKGITYEAALALEGQTKHGRSPKLGECDLCSPPKDEAKKPPGENNDKGNKFGIPLDLFRTDKKKYQRLWSRCKNKGITYEAALALEGQTKHGRPPKVSTGEKTPAPRKEKHVTPPGRQVLNDLVIAKNGTLSRGQLVRHNGSKASPFFGKEGEILKIADDGQVFVKFGVSSTWLPPYLVTVVAAAGAGS